MLLPNTGCDSVADIFFVVDSSGSIRDKNPPDGSRDNWQLILDFVANVVERFRVGAGSTDVRIGFIKYSNNAEIVFYLDTYQDKNSIISAVRNVRYGGGFTNTQEALRLLRTQGFQQSRGDRMSALNIAIVITDGESNAQQQNTVPEAERLQNMGVTVFTIGVTSAVNINEIRRISSAPRTENVNWFTAPDFTDLTTILNTVLERACPTLPPLTPTVTRPRPGRLHTH